MLNSIIENQTFYEIFWLIILIIYVFLVAKLTKKYYNTLIKKGTKKDSAMYVNRKMVHIFAGGVVALAVPLVFNTPLYPLICGLALTVLTFISHKRGNVMYWFQSNKNRYDVNFCLMWGLSIFILWIWFDNAWIAIIPAAFMSFGDGITGIIRNLVLEKREKHFVGNLYMAGVCLPLGYGLGGLGGIAVGGAIAGLVASVVERYEFGIIDDNVLVTVSSSLVLMISNFFTNGFPVIS